jgi:hypothetical protein
MNGHGNNNKRDKPIKLQTLDTREWAELSKQTLHIFNVFDVVDGSSPDPTPAGVDSDNNSATFTALPYAQHDFRVETQTSFGQGGHPYLSFC